MRMHVAHGLYFEGTRNPNIQLHVPTYGDTMCMLLKKVSSMCGGCSGSNIIGPFLWQEGTLINRHEPAEMRITNDSQISSNYSVNMLFQGRF
jgi:hypothetical protein